MGCPMTMPTTTSTASTSSAGPSTSRGILGSDLRVSDQTARSCLARPCRSGSWLSSFFFDPRATPRVYEACRVGDERLRLRAVTSPPAVGHHRGPGVAPGLPLAAVLPDGRKHAAGDI